MLTGRDILCISSVDWDFHWQIHHELMSTLAAQGNRVLFIENTGVRAPGVSDMRRVRQRIRNWWHSTKGFRLERENLFVYSPLFLPSTRVLAAASPAAPAPITTASYSGMGLNFARTGRTGLVSP